MKSILADDLHFFLLLAALYIIVLALGGWLVMRTEHRQFWSYQFSLPLKWIQQISGRLRIQATYKNEQARSVTKPAMRFLKGNIFRHKAILLMTLAVLSSPVFLALSLSPRIMFDTYDNASRSDPVIAALLKGEQLVQPPPLPPQVFVTREVESLRPGLATASREWMLLDTDFRQRLLTVYRLMAGRGYQMALIEGYRSPERQSLLARAGPHVTNVDAYRSYHQYGLAADSAFYRNGKLVISERDGWAMEGYRLYGQYAESVGLVWGGRWQMMDFGHVEFRKPKVLEKN